MRDDDSMLQAFIFVGLCVCVFVFLGVGLVGFLRV